MNEEKTEIKRGRPQVIAHKAMVLFRGKEKAIFDEWRNSRKLTDEERKILGVTKEFAGISDALRLCMLRNIESERREKLKN